MVKPRGSVATWLAEMKTKAPWRVISTGSGSAARSSGARRCLHCKEIGCEIRNCAGAKVKIGDRRDRDREDERGAVDVDEEPRRAILAAKRIGQSMAVKLGCEEKSAMATVPAEVAGPRRVFWSGVTLPKATATRPALQEEPSPNPRRRAATSAVASCDGGLGRP